MYLLGGLRKALAEKFVCLTEFVVSFTTEVSIYWLGLQLIILECEVDDLNSVRSHFSQSTLVMLVTPAARIILIQQ